MPEIESIKYISFNFLETLITSYKNINLLKIASLNTSLPHFVVVACTGNKLTTSKGKSKKKTEGYFDKSIPIHER